MIVEKMLELFLLEHYNEYSVIRNIDYNKYLNRLEELRKEFLEQYVTDTTRKSN